MVTGRPLLFAVASIAIGELPSPAILKDWLP